MRFPHRRLVTVKAAQPLSRFTLMLIALLSLSATASVAAKDSPSGDEKNLNDSSAKAKALAQAVYDRPSGDNISSRVIMALESKGKVQKKRLLYSYGADKGKGERWGLMRFITPKDIAGTGLLSIDHPGDESDQWLYLPSLDRVRRIASSRKGGRFVGSDFFYEDLSDREVSMDNHRLLGSDEVGGVSCTLLESTPVEKSNSVYSKRVSCIHDRLLIPLRVDFYTRGDKPVKRLQASKIRKVQGYWTVYQSTMTDLKKNHKTHLITTDVIYDQQLPDNLFTQRGLADENLEKPFRPRKSAPQATGDKDKDKD